MDTHFWLYNKDHTHIDDYEVMHFDGKTVSLDENTRFVASKPTKLVAHGLGGGIHIDQIFNAAYAEAGYDYNVIGIDWREMQGDGYKAILDLAGNYSARFLKGMVEDYELQLNDVHAIGFSYGTHVIGKSQTFLLNQLYYKKRVETYVFILINLLFKKVNNDSFIKNCLTSFM